MIDYKLIKSGLDIADRVKNIYDKTLNLKSSIGFLTLLLASNLNYGLEKNAGKSSAKSIDLYINEIRPVASHIIEDVNLSSSLIPSGLDKLLEKNISVLNSDLLNSEDQRFSYIVIDKNSQVASVYLLKLSLKEKFLVSTGEFRGDKGKQGDKKTPNGLFSVVSVEDSRNWYHDGTIGAYGNYFSRLDAGSWDSNGKFNSKAKSSIGLHGTNEPEKIGLRASDGCIRFHSDVNDYLVESGILKKGTYVGIFGK